jgi:D-glycero-alpha-D-manno-heptose-7-phosphate kinase
MPSVKRKRINAIAPTRICDIGGWTDTWFAEHGAVLNIAVYPYVEVQIDLEEKVHPDRRVVVSVENFGHTYSIDPGHVTYEKHPLIEAAIDVMQIPREAGFRVNIFSDAPPGASTGTSAAVSVALIGALDVLTQGRLAPHEVAALAHSIETEKLGLQCGVQDQLASAYGGINFIEIRSFPYSSVSSMQIPNSVWWELEHRLAAIYIGTPHSSSEIHQRVIAGLGARPCNDSRLQRLRELAMDAKNALYAGDLAALGRVMNENTDVQRRLHPELVCAKFEEIISVANDFGALGCKVNGAGGDGGSLTILTDGDMSKKRRLVTALREKSFPSLPIYLSRQGLRVW